MTKQDQLFFDTLYQNTGIVFDEAQASAIVYDCKHSRKALRLVAGAGSGKTATICAKVAYLVNVCGVQENRIAMVTFTHKAAEEMSMRIEQYLGRPNKVRIGTFHNLFRLLYASVKSCYPSTCTNCINGRLALDEVAAELRKLVSKYRIYDANTESYPLQAKISCWINTGHSEQEMIQSLCNSYWDSTKGVKDPFHPKNLSAFFQEFNDFKRRNGILDFDDLLLNLYKAVCNSTEVAYYLKRLFSYLIIDEFQDINWLQWEIVKFIAQDSPVTSLVAVGDDDQSIYMFRGSMCEFFNQMDIEFPTETLFLMANYRCKNPAIVEAANRLIRVNSDRLDKPCMVCKGTGNAKPVIKCVDKRSEIAEFIAKTIVDYCTKKKCFYSGTSLDEELCEVFINGSDYKYDDFFILYRSSDQISPIIDSLLRMQIPFVFNGDFSDLLYPFNSRPFRSLWDALLVLRSKPDSLQLWKSLFGVLAGCMYVRKSSTIEYLDSCDSIDSIIHNSQKFLETSVYGYHVMKMNDAFRNFLKCIRNFVTDYSTEEDYQVFLDNLSKLRVYQELEEEDNSLYSYLFSSLKQYDSFLQLLESYVSRRDQYSKMKIRNEAYEAGKYNGINLMTIHKSKGLTFKNVFIIGCEKDVFRVKNAINLSDIDDGVDLFADAEPPSLIEEERRIMYVAMTRCTDNLYVVYVNKPSIFIQEMQANGEEGSPLGQASGVNAFI